MKKDVFCGINFCNVGILWKKGGINFCDPECFNITIFFSTESKKEDTIYMGIIYMSFLSRNLLCKNIYTMSSFMWSNELFSILKWWLYLYCIFLFSFLTYEDSYSKNIIFFWNPEFIFPIAFQTVFCGTYFCDWLIQNCIFRIKFLRFLGKIRKLSSATIYNHKNFCP